MTSINTANYINPSQQGADKATTANNAAKDFFMDYMNKTSEERMIDQILNELGVTREEMEAMSPKDRRKLELKIEEKIREKVEAKVKG